MEKSKKEVIYKMLCHCINEAVITDNSFEYDIFNTQDTKIKLGVN